MTTRRKRTKEQVEAWLYAVLNPILGCLQVERSALRLRNPWWRFGARRCEVLRPLREYVAPGHEPTLAQLCRYDERIDRVVKGHDSGLAEIERLCSELHGVLLRLPDTEDLARAFESEDPRWRGSYKPEQGPALVAQHVINWSRTDPVENTGTDVWRRHRERALALRDREGVRDLSAALDRAMSDLERVIEEALPLLERVRDEYADAFGLPPAPLHEPPFLTEPA